MASNLVSLLEQVQTDIGKDFIATDVVDMDGMSLGGVRGRDNFNSEIVAAHFTIVMKFAARVSEHMKMGVPVENLVTTDKALVLTRFLGDGSLYWLLVVSKNATLGLLRTLMDEYELRIWGAIPS